MKLIVLIHRETDMKHVGKIYNVLKESGLRTPCDWTGLHDTKGQLKYMSQIKRNQCVMFIVPYRVGVETDYEQHLRTFDQASSVPFLFIEPTQDIRKELRAFTGLKIF